MPVAILTDSTADLDPNRAAELGVEVVPLFVHFGNRSFRDCIDITREEFYRRLTADDVLPTTSQAPTSAYEDFFASHAKAGNEIVCLAISGQLSGTVNAALAAAAQFPGATIRVFDSRTVSGGLLLLVLRAVELARRGEGSAAIVAELERVRAVQGMFAAIPDLSHAVRTGRVSRAMAMIGGIVKICPVLTLDGEGKVAEHARVRTFSRALDALVEATVRTLEGATGARVAIVHARAPEIAGDLRARLLAALPAPPASLEVLENRPGHRHPCRDRSGWDIFATRLAYRPHVPAAIYVHLPFCPYICPYCDFAKVRFERGAAQRYLEALEAEVDAAPALAGTTLFFGGGTPNTIPLDGFLRLLERLRGRFAIGDGAEVTVEINPDLDLCEDLAQYRAAGVTRLSIGVQSFDRGELRALGRKHSAEDVATVAARARAAGFEDLSLDLIFGTPGSTLASWERSLESALALTPDHLSTYGLTVEPGTPYAAWQAREPRAFAGEELEREQYEAAIERLTAAGFEQYEISNFARPGHRSAHNQNYWDNGEYLGLGVGAASFLGGVRSVHTRDLDAYVRAASAGAPIPGSSERLEGAARLGEAAMLALRTREGVDLRRFRERYGVDFLTSYDRPIGELRELGMLELTATHVRLTRAGRFVANDVCGEFIA